MYYVIQTNAISSFIQPNFRHFPEEKENGIQEGFTISAGNSYYSAVHQYNVVLYFRHSIKE